mgnify:CR=1 FL=1
MEFRRKFEVDTILTDWSPPEVRVLKLVSCLHVVVMAWGLQQASLGKIGMGTQSIMIILAIWTLKVGHLHT